jgi:hypothetical protein
VRDSTCAPKTVCSGREELLCDKFPDFVSLI